MTYKSGQKILNIEIIKQSFLLCKKSQKVDNTEIILLEVTISYKGHMIKLFTKAQDARCLSGQKLSIIEQNPEIENFIIELTQLLQN